MDTKEMINALNEVYDEIVESTGGTIKKSEVLKKIGKVITELTERYESSK